MTIPNSAALCAVSSVSIQLTQPPDPSTIRLVALDIDGTLVNAQGHISPRVARAVKDVLDRGVLVILCTGRSFSRGVKGVAAELGLTLPAIVRNGTAVQDALTGAVLEQHPVPPEDVSPALDLMLRAGLSPIVEEGPRHGDGLYTLPGDQCHPAVFYYAAEWERAMNLRHLSGAADLYHIRDPNWIGGCGERAATESVFQALQTLPGVTPYWSGPWQVDDRLHCAGVSPAGCSKASALARYAAGHGIDLTEVLAIGDYLNDIEMLREVGWGVAMGHAPAPVKAVANAIAPDITQDGAAVALEQYVLGRR